MKKLFLFGVLAIALMPVFAQQHWMNNLPQDKVSNGTVTFFEMQKAFYEYWKPFKVNKGRYIDSKGVDVKAPGWKQFKRWEWYWETRINPLTGEFPTTSAWEEMQKFQADNLGSVKSVSGNWTSSGPTASPGGYAGLGRLNCVGFHPTDNNIIYAGSASGGLWKTTNGGTSWSVLTDNLAVLGVSDICISTADPYTIYIATGDKNAYDNNSIGVMKSTDGGATWNTTGLSFVISSRKLVYRLLMDPTNNTILYAATSDGFFKTTDAGASWSNLYSSELFRDLEFKPGTPTTIYGSTNYGDIYCSIDGGVTWTNRLTTSFSRVEMTVSPANANYVYAVMEDNPYPVDESPVYKSINGGETFTRVFTSTSLSLLGYECNGSDVGKTQAWYDLTISSDPTDANIVFVGGINVWKSTDGGSTWNINSHWSSTCSDAVSTVHADQHCLAYQPTTNVLFLGNDGGLYKTTNTGASWSFIGSGIVNSQLYRIGVSQTVASEVVAGLQDNGTKLFSGGIWNDVKGGDGMECIVDYSNANIQYGTYVEGQIDRTTDHWATRIPIQPASAGSGYWVTPYIIDPTNSQTLYAGYADVWKTTDRGTNWTKISTMNTASKLRSMAIAASNTQVLYVADPSIIWKTTDGGTNWINITAGLPVSTNYITYISVKADDPLTVWVTFGGYNASKVYQTTNGGTNWADISTGLPSIPVMCVIQNKQVTSRVDLYAATDVGVFLKAGNADWQVFSTGLPNVLTTELEIYYDANQGNSKLFAGTYGRGLWVSDLYESGILNPTNVTSTARSNTQIDLSWALASGNSVMLAYSTSPTFGTPVDGTSYAASSAITGGGTVLYNGSNTSFNHTSLNQNTTYYYKIWSKDGSTTYSTGVTTNTTTFCTLVSTFPWTEGFEHAAVMPECWTQQYISGSNNWEMQTTGYYGHPASAHTGTYLARNLTMTANAGNVTKFVTPAFNLTSVTSPYLTFWHTQEFWPNDQDQLRIYYKTSQTGTWVLLATYTNSIASWTQESIALPNPSSAYFIAFESTVNAGYGVCLDDIMVSSPIADFTSNVNASCTGSLIVNFTDASIGSNNSWAWDIDNNGTTDYTTQNPTHTYSSPGLYSVKLTVNNGGASKTKENLILVMGSLEPKANVDCPAPSNANNNGNTYGIGIYRFALGNINNITPYNDGSYNNYACSQGTTLELNKTYTVTLQTGTSNNEGAAVYIDYTNDGDFTDAGEAIGSYIADKAGVHTFSFTTPSTGVVPDKGLRLRAISKYSATPGSACDNTYYGQAEDYTVYFITDATWNGISGTDWFTTTNWSYSSVPGEGINAKIPSGCKNYPILTNNVTCRDLKIESGASITIAPKKSLTVSGVLTNNAGNAGLVIKSDDTGTGSLIHSTTGVNGTFERYMNNADWANWKDGWHFLSSPVMTQAISSAFTTDPATEYDFYSWYEAQNVWVNYKNTSDAPTWLTANNSSLNFVPGKGYMAAYNNEGTKQFSGSLYVADVPVSNLVISGSTAANRSWHLLGNPFASALTWDASDPWSLSNIAGVAKIWNEVNQSYSDLSSSPASIIPATNGFMVQVASGTGSLTLPASKRVHSSQAFYKSANTGVKLTASNMDFGNAQESNIVINPDATEGFDLMFDGEFISGYAPQFYSLAGSERLSTNSLPELPTETGILFAFVPNDGINFRIEAKGLETFDATTWLLDKMTSMDMNLTLNPVYNFTATSTDITDRFLLHFISTAGINELGTSEQSKVWYSDHKLMVYSQADKSQLEVCDPQGRIILKKQFNSKGIHSLAFDRPLGFYVARISVNSKVKSTKFIAY